MTQRVKAGLLACLVIVLTGLVALRISTGPIQAHVPLEFQTGQSLSREAALRPVSVPAVARSATLRNAVPALEAVKNVFAPIERRRATRDPEAVQTAAKRSREKAAMAQAAGSRNVLGPTMPVLSAEELAARLARQQRELATEQAKQLMGQYRFIGFLTTNGEPRAFLRKGRDLYIVRTGELLDHQIQVASIDGALLKLRGTSIDVERALPLVR